MRKRIIPLLLLPILTLASCGSTEKEESYQESSFSSSLKVRRSLKSWEEAHMFDDVVIVTLSLSFSEEVYRNGHTHLKELEEDDENLSTSEAVQLGGFTPGKKAMFTIPLKTPGKEKLFAAIDALLLDERVDDAKPNYWAEID